MAAKFAAVIAEATIITVLEKKDMSKIGKKKAMEQLMTRLQEQARDFDKQSLETMLLPKMLELSTNIIMGLSV